MGRHMIASSPLRSPAVVFGVPVATVLATMGSNAMLGGVIPSAEEMPLRAESVVDTPADALPGPPAWPSSSPAATSGIVDGAFGERVVSGRSEAARAADDTATGTIRVVRVADEPTVRCTAASPADGVRVVREGPRRVAERSDQGVRERAGTDGADDGAGDGPVSAVVERTSATSDDAPAGGVQRVAAASSVVRATSDDHSEGSEGGSDSAVVDLDTPSGGLSLLSFG